MTASTQNQNSNENKSPSDEAEKQESEKPKSLVNGYSKFGNALFFGTWIINGAVGLQDLPFIINIISGLMLSSSKTVSQQRSIILFLLAVAFGTGFYVMQSVVEDKTGLLLNLLLESEEDKKKKKEAKEKEKSDRENRK